MSRTGELCVSPPTEIRSTPVWAMVERERRREPGDAGPDDDDGLAAEHR